MNPWFAYLLGVLTVPALIAAAYAFFFLRYFGFARAAFFWKMGAHGYLKAANTILDLMEGQP